MNSFGGYLNNLKTKNIDALNQILKKKHKKQFLSFLSVDCILQILLLNCKKISGLREPCLDKLSLKP